MPLGSGTLGSGAIGDGSSAPYVAPVATVTGVTLTPAAVSLAAGATQQFAWAVQGANNPPQTVTLTALLGTINSAGLYQQPARTSVAQVDTITARSTLDNTKFATATVTIAALPVVDPPAPDPVLAQRFARPVRDVSKGAWQASSGTSLFPMVDDMALDNSDFISASAGTCELGLGTVKDPGTSTNQAVRYSAHAPDGGSLTVTLKQGATVIASWHHDTLPVVATVHEQRLTPEQCDAVTDYRDLRVELVAA